MQNPRALCCTLLLFCFTTYSHAVALSFHRATANLTQPAASGTANISWAPPALQSQPLRLQENSGANHTGAPAANATNPFSWLPEVSRPTSYVIIGLAGLGAATLFSACLYGLYRLYGRCVNNRRVVAHDLAEDLRDEYVNWGRDRQRSLEQRRAAQAARPPRNRAPEARALQQHADALRAQIAAIEGLPLQALEHKQSLSEPLSPTMPLASNLEDAPPREADFLTPERPAYPAGGPAVPGDVLPAAIPAGGDL